MADLPLSFFVLCCQCESVLIHSSTNRPCVIDQKQKLFDTIIAPCHQQAKNQLDIFVVRMHLFPYISGIGISRGLCISMPYICFLSFIQDYHIHVLARITAFAWLLLEIPFRLPLENHDDVKFYLTSLFNAKVGISHRLCCNLTMISCLLRSLLYIYFNA